MAEKQVVTPWEVKGEIDYNRLIEKFGLTPLKGLPKKFDNLLFRRNIVFAHRDFGRIVDAVEKKKRFAMICAPSSHIFYRQ